MPNKDHVDNWLDTPTFVDEDNENYAKFVIEFFRLPAWKKTAFNQWTKQFKLFCKHDGKAYRVTGASRLGDIWLTSDFEQEVGYELRVSLKECSNWSPECK